MKNKTIVNIIINIIKKITKYKILKFQILYADLIFENLY